MLIVLYSLLGALFSVLSSILVFGEGSEFSKEPMIMTAVPEFGQKSHTSLSLDFRLNFLTFVRQFWVMTMQQLLKSSSVSHHFLLLSKKFKKVEG